jgi:3-oxoacyl-(acyl-carrier-protein) synthase/acyl carrier protein
MDQQFLIDVSHPVVRDHRVAGRHLLPGLAYIDWIHQFLRGKGIAPDTVELRNLSIYEPLVVEEGRPVSVALSATNGPGNEMTIVLEAEVRPTGSAPLPRRRLVSVTAAPCKAIEYSERIDPKAFRWTATTVIDAARVYSKYEALGLVHGDFMRIEGSLFLTGAAVYVDAKLGKRSASADGVIFHPALLDGGALCAAAGVVDAGYLVENRLLLPVHFDSFRSSRPLLERCIIRVRPEGVRLGKGVSFIDLDFFDEQGRKVAELKNLAGAPSGANENNASAEKGKLLPGTNTNASEVRVSASSPEPFASPNALTTIESYERMVSHSVMETWGWSLEQTSNVDSSFHEAGIDSQQMLKLLERLESAVGSNLSPTLLFEYTSVSEVARYLFEQYPPRTADTSALRTDSSESSGQPMLSANESPGLARDSHLARSMEVQINHSPSPASSSKSPDRVPDVETARAECGYEAIAIVGIVGRFPGAQSVADLWKALQRGTDCVEEVPRERWSLAEHEHPGVRLCRWGGFLRDVDVFDARFFNVLPRHAELMDPQERMFLQSAWELLETAGYTRESLRRTTNGRVGVYVGSMYQEYGHVPTDEASETGAFLAFQSAIANRVSHFFDFNGPSMAVESMCSSAAVALHNACNDLRSGECLAAIVGGVNLSLNAKKFVALSASKRAAVSRDDRSFGNGEGYLPAEAIGAMLLKPLAAAERDGDKILGLVRSSAINHNGRSNAYAAPNPRAQAQVVETALTRAGVSARAIGHVEAAATGAAVSDAIELSTLSRIFATGGRDGSRCSIGTVKSNIGHAEAASAVTQIAKVLMQLQEGKRPPVIGAEHRNPYFDWSSSPFLLASTLEAWERQTVIVDGQTRALPRRALINSFGAGGTNAAIVLEEYVDRRAAGLPPPGHESGRSVVVLSARDAERLRQVVLRLIEVLRGDGQASLIDIAHTLQVGREAMSCRLALVVSSREELLQGLEACIVDTSSDSTLRCGAVIFRGEKSGSSVVSRCFVGKAAEAMLSVLIAEGDLERLAQLWVQGADVAWATLCPRATIVQLPTYPFRTERHWLPAPEDRSKRRSLNVLTDVPANIVEETDAVADGELDCVAAQATAPRAANEPRNALERAIAYVWMTHLGLKTVSIEDEFFDLGGDSLLARSVLGAYEEEFGVRLDLRAFMTTANTVAGAAVTIVTELARKRGVVRGADSELVLA